MGRWNVPLPTVIATILEAFSGPLNDRIPAGHLPDICSFFRSNLAGWERWVNLKSLSPHQVRYHHLATAQAVPASIVAGSVSALPGIFPRGALP